jgi:predicted permease
MPEWKQLVRDQLQGLKLEGAGESEIVDELSQHLEDRYDALRATGLSEPEARQQTLDELKDGRILTEELRKIRRPSPVEPMGIPTRKGVNMSSYISDLKIALRNMRTKAAFSLMVIGMLALGVAGNAAIFSIFNGLFLRPLPFPEAQQLIDLDETAPKWNLHYVGVSNPDFFLWRSNNSTFDGMAFFSQSSFNLSDRGNAQRLLGANVTHDLLNVLRLKPALGRTFLPEEDRPGGAKVTMLGYDLWQRMFQGDRNVLGRVLQLDNQSFTVVGVLPREAVLPDKCELWTPLAADPDPKKGTGWYLSGVGRMKHGVSPEQAQADLLRVHKSVIKEQQVNEITSPILTPLRDRILGDFRTVSRILLGAVAVVLLIACVNIAALMMVRGSTRAREIAIRTAMGASRARIVRQLLTENLMLAAVGGLLGVALGDLFLHAMISLMPANNLPRWVSFAMDARFAVFCAAITGVSALLFGLAPIIQASKVDTRGSLMDAGVRSSLSRGRQMTLSALVVCEISLALMLSIGAGLLVQAFHKVLNVDPGFRPENVISYRINLPDVKYPKPEQSIAFFENLVERTRSLPGIKAVGATSAPPLGGHWGNFWEAEGNPPLGPNDKNPVVLQVVVTPGYFDAIGMTLLDGRVFQDQDVDSKHGLHGVIVNETFAKHFWPGVKPIGKRIRYRGSKIDWIEVVGLTRDEKHYGLDQEMKPSVFLPLRGVSRNSMSIVLRGSIEPQVLVAPARELLRQMDPDLPMYDIRAMTERLEVSLWARRAYSWLFGAFAIIAVVLAAAGIYGVVSYAVSQRTQEIGIRMALGAQPGQVMRGILKSGMLMVSIGMVLGVAGALAAVRLLQTLLFGVSARDPWIYGAVLLGVACVGLLANMLPARRAASVDPMRALRFE